MASNRIHVFGGARGRFFNAEDRIRRQVEAALTHRRLPSLNQITQEEIASLPSDLRVVAENMGLALQREISRKDTEVFAVASNAQPGEFIPFVGEASPLTDRDWAAVWNLPRTSYPGQLRTPFPTWEKPQPKTVARPSKDILQRVAIADIQPVDDMDLRASLALEAETLLGYSVLRKELKLTSPLAATLKELEIEPFSSESVELYKLQMRNFAAQEARKENPGAYAAWVKDHISVYEKPVPELALQKACEIKRALPAADIFIEELNIYPDPFLVAELGGERFYIEVWDEPKFQGS